jgi:hypothetical protein
MWWNGIAERFHQLIKHRSTIDGRQFHSHRAEHPHIYSDSNSCTGALPDTRSEPNTAAH